jgi:hypothetical protein
MESEMENEELIVSREVIIEARSLTLDPARTVQALLNGDSAMRAEILGRAFLSAIAKMIVSNDKRTARAVQFSLSETCKQSKAVKLLTVVFDNALALASGNAGEFINISGRVTDYVPDERALTAFANAAQAISEGVKIACAPKPKAPKVDKADKAGELETPQTPVIGVDPQSHAELLSEFNTVAAKATENAEKIRALTADLSVKSAALKNAETQIELLKRQLEGQKLTNYGLKTRAKRLRGLATGYKNKAQKVNNKPTRVAKSHIKA